MATQTIATTKGQEMIEKFGVKIGGEAWQEIEDFLRRYKENSDSEFSPDNVLFFDTEGGEHKEEEFVELFKNMVKTIGILARDSKKEFHEYYIITEGPLKFSLGYEYGIIREELPTYTELLPFLFLGIARGAWTIEDAIYHIGKCTVQNLRAKS